METAPTPPLLLTGINPGAPGPRAKETIVRLLKLLGAPLPSPTVVTPKSCKPHLILLKGGKQDDPPPAA